MKGYVLGFAFILGSTPNTPEVILIKKKKPEWQAGLLNGVGGKVEEGESPEEAMVREFREETGVETVQSNWHNYSIMGNEHFCVDIYWGLFGSLQVQSLTEEEIGTYTISDLRSKYSTENFMVNNVPSLIEMAIMCMNYTNDTYEIAARVGESQRNKNT